MNNETILGGKAELSIGNILIPAQLLGNIKPNFAEGTRDTSSLAGTVKKPSGTFETAEVGGTMLLPSMDALKTLWSEAYNAPTGSNQKTGNVIWGGNSCETKDPLPVNIHYTCDKTDDNDVHVYAGLVAMNFSPEYNESDGLTVEFTIYAQPTENGYVRFGTGDLTKPSYYDVESMSTKALSPAPTPAP